MYPPCHEETDCLSDYPSGLSAIPALAGRRRNLHQEVEAQREENARLRERNEALNAQVLDLKQGLDAIEERAREDMGMVKQGETFYQIVE